MGAVVNEEAFCLKWNDFHTSLTSSFLELRAESDLLGMVSHKKSLITIYGHKHKIKKFHKNL